MTFSQQIRAYRIAAGLTQSELADKIGYSGQTVNNWETGRIEPWPRKKDTILQQVKHMTGCDRFSEDNKPAPAVIGVKRTRPNVCEEITGESSSKIDFRRPPARN